MTKRHDSTRNVIRTSDPRAMRDVAVNQGQVLLETDHNQKGDLILARVERGTSDILGAPERLVVQAGSSAFELAGGVGGGNFAIGPGHGWLDGWMVENAEKTSFKEQPHPPFEAKFGELGAIAVKALVRYVDPVEEPVLADKALGEAQASGCTLIDWQAFPVPLSEDEAKNCAATYASDTWSDMSAPSTGKAAFLAEASVASIDPCSLTPEGGYSRLENLLYRVEVHTGPKDPAINNCDGPRFGLDKIKVKFSRRNASVMARVTKISGSEVTVMPSARDPRTWFAPGQYAEIVSVHNDLDAAGALRSESLFRVAAINGDKVTLDATGAQINATGASDDGTWFLRLWDAFPDGSGVQEIALSGGGKSQKIDLGDGLAIQLRGNDAARLRRGDFWTCRASADGTIEWPTSGGSFDFLLPEGPETRYAILGVYKISGSAIAPSDCRVPFAPLTEQIQVIPLGGDGQEVLADSKNDDLVRLPYKLRVGVIRGSTPVAGETIQFRVVDGAGDLDGSGGTIQVATDSQGIAEVVWRLSSDLPAQQVQAIRLDELGKQTHAPIHFNAFLSSADQTSFDPSNTPSLSGAFDVQTAIEMLAGQGQVGCSTYVIQEGSDWVAILNAIKDEEDASVCFQRGIYTTKKTVCLQKKGHLKISGAGPGTRIIAEGVEVALKFDHCASVDISHLHVSTPTAGHLIEDNEHRQGAITISHCPDVAVSDSILQCGAAASAERCCLRIAGMPLEDYRVSVTQCDFRTGYMQDALIISDSDHITVRDNSFETVARPEIVDFPILAKGPGWLNAASRALVRSIRSTIPPQGGAGPVVVGKKFTTQLASAIPQAEWNAVVAEMPPRAADERSKASFDRYIEGLVTKVLEKPNLVPSFEANLAELEKGLGSAAGKQLSEPVRRNLLVSNVEAAIPLRAKKAPSPPGLRTVSLTAGNHAVTFDTPMSSNDWNKALNKSGWKGQIDNYSSFRRVVYRLSKRMIKVDNFSAELPSFQAWLPDYVERASSFSRDAISCVGKTLGLVSISGNRIKDFQLGVRVATSHGTWAWKHNCEKLKNPDYLPLSTRVVDVFNNQLLLRTQGPRAQAITGMFIGHANTVRVHGNDVHYSDNRNTEGETEPLDYLEGIRLYGHFGRLVSVKDNHVTVAPRAIRMTYERVIGPRSVIGTPYNWVLADNMGNPWRDEYEAVYLEVPDLHKVKQRNNIL